MSELEIEIEEEKENKLLNRRDLVFIVTHGNSPIPSRDRMRDKISNFMDVPKDRIVIDNIEAKFGMDKAKIISKVYNNKDDVIKYESEHSIRRNKIQG